MLQQTTESSERRVRAREIVLSQVKSARPFATPTTNDTFLRFVPSLVSRDDDGVICECEYSEEFLEKPSLGLAVMLLNQYCDNVKPFADSLMERSRLRSTFASSTDNKSPISTLSRLRSPGDNRLG